MKFSAFFLGLFAGIYIIVFPVLAQQNFTILQSGDYQEVTEKTEYQPSALISGHYKAYYTTRRTAPAQIADSINTMGQEIELKFRSLLNRHVSVNATVRNLSANFEDQATGYYTEDPNESGDASQDTGFYLEFREAYLEYNHNPTAIFRIGRQYVDIGSEKGFIYDGEATGITQDCKIGTWCYYIGGVRLDKKGDDTVYWVQLDYPVYNNGVIVNDIWNETEGRPESSLNIEIFRIPYHGSDIPIAAYGGSTGNNSFYHSKNSADSLPVYFDNKKVEYSGFNIRWNYYEWMLNFDFITLAGDRDYHTGTSTQGAVTSLGERFLSGDMAFLELDYNLDEEWQMGIDILKSSGTEQTSEKLWEKDSEAYFEIQKGRHGDAQIYFSGKHNRGDGHSVSNLEYQSLRILYRDQRETLAIDIAYYNFRRSLPVLNQDEKSVQQIGKETDFLIRWNLEQSLSFQLSIATFQPEEAYAQNDNLVPSIDNKNIWAIGLDASYHF